MAGTGSESHEINCQDFAFFQEKLKQMRTLDDRIVNALNTSIPTTSFTGKENPAERCKGLFEEMTAAHLKRKGVIKHCIQEGSARVDDLKKQYALNDENLVVQQKLKKEQSTLRMIRQELSVEEIVRDRSIKVFYERCRPHYVPENTKL